MKVGCIGLGDIAQKAYLPVLAVQPGLELHLQTRTPATLEQVADALHLPAANRHADLGSLIGAGLDAAFVHAPTDVHPEIVTRLLEAGVPTYVDKPLAYELADSERLVALAEERGTSLAVGFNRRFAPGYAQCADHPRELILMQKNRVGLPEEPRRMVLDDFIHVVDTLRFLVPGQVDDVTVRARTEDGLLHHVVLQLSGDGFTALGVMNRLRLRRGDPRGVRPGHQAPGGQPGRGGRPQGPADRAAAWRLGAGLPAARHRAGGARLPGRGARGQGAQRP